MNAIASWNIEAVLVRARVSHVPMGWLKEVAPWNMPSIVVTRETFHVEMSALNDSFPVNRTLMSVMAETSHVPMAGAHAPSGEAARQFAIARSRAARLVYTWDGGGGGGGDGGDGGLGKPTASTYDWRVPWWRRTVALRRRDRLSTRSWLTVSMTLLMDVDESAVTVIEYKFPPIERASTREAPTIRAMLPDAS